MDDFKKPVGRIIVPTYVRLAVEQHIEVSRYAKAICDHFDLTLECKKYNKLEKFELQGQEDYTFLLFEFYHPNPNSGHTALLDGVAAYLFALGFFYMVTFEKYPYKAVFS